MALNPVESDGERSALSESGYFYMFCSLMKHIIVCYFDSTLVVTKENSRPRKSDSHIFK